MKRKFLRHLAITSLFCALLWSSSLDSSWTSEVGAPSTSGSPIEPLEKPEENYDLLPVGGRVDMGLFFGAPEAIADTDDLWVAVPAAPSSVVCLELNSVDGMIWARARYDLNGRRAGIYRLRLPLTRGALLRRYRAKEVAVRVHESTCETQGGRLFPITWQRAVDANATRRCWLQLNSDAFETTIDVLATDATSARSRCAAMTTPLAQRTFNQTCFLQFPASRSLFEARIQRRTAGNFLPPIVLRVLLP